MTLVTTLKAMALPCPACLTIGGARGGPFNVLSSPKTTTALRNSTNRPSWIPIPQKVN